MKTQMQKMAEMATRKAYEIDIKKWQTAHGAREPPNTKNDRPTQFKNTNKLKRLILRKGKK
jgi:hypothetical protein